MLNMTWGGSGRWVGKAALLSLAVGVVQPSFALSLNQIQNQIASASQANPGAATTSNPNTQFQIAQMLANDKILAAQITPLTQQDVTDAMVRFWKTPSASQSKIVSALIQSNADTFSKSTPNTAAPAGSQAGIAGASLIPYLEQAGLCSGDPTAPGGRMCAVLQTGDQVSSTSTITAKDGSVRTFPAPQPGSALWSIFDAVGHPQQTSFTAAATTSATDPCAKQSPDTQQIEQAAAGFGAIPVFTAGTALTLLPVPEGAVLAPIVQGLGIFAGTYSFFFGTATGTASAPICTLNHTRQTAVTIEGQRIPFTYNYAFGYTIRYSVNSGFFGIGGSVHVWGEFYGVGDVQYLANSADSAFAVVPFGVRFDDGDIYGFAGCATSNDPNYANCALQYGHTYGWQLRPHGSFLINKLQATCLATPEAYGARPSYQAIAQGFVSIPWVRNFQTNYQDAPTPGNEELGFNVYPVPTSVTIGTVNNYNGTYYTQANDYTYTFNRIETYAPEVVFSGSDDDNVMNRCGATYTYADRTASGDDFWVYHGEPATQSNPIEDDDYYLDPVNIVVGFYLYHAPIL